MKPIPEDQLPEGFKYTSIFGFENLHEVSSRADGETWLRVFAMLKEPGDTHNYLVRISDVDLSDKRFMSRLKEKIKRSFVSVIEGEPK